MKKLRGLIISAIIFGLICSVICAVLVVSDGKFMAVAEGWARASTLAFLFAIACSLIPEK